MSTVPTAELPAVVIGAGPSGLAAAAHLRSRDIPVVVLEAGPAVGAAVREWGHVRLFSAWSELVDPAAEELLAARARYARNRYSKKRAVKKDATAAARKPRSMTVDKGVLVLHRRGKSLCYIATLLNMKVSIIQKIINDSNQNNQ